MDSAAGAVPAGVSEPRGRYCGVSSAGRRISFRTLSTCGWQDLSKRCWKHRKITLELTEAARKADLCKAGYDRAYGARPLKRAIQRMVQDKLAMKILDGTVLHGDKVVVDAGRDGLLFTVAERMAA